jgi:uncharacterized protein
VVDKNILLYITADYILPFLPFMLGTFGFALMLIAVFMFIGNKVSHLKYAQLLSHTGQMTLTHYVSHLTIGMLLFSVITGKSYINISAYSTPTNPLHILLFAIAYFIISCVFSYFWRKKFKAGPLESVMRKISG